MDFTSYDLAARASVLLDSNDKVRRFLMETTRVIKALSDCDALNYYERRGKSIAGLLVAIVRAWPVIRRP